MKTCRLGFAFVSLLGIASCGTGGASSNNKESNGNGNSALNENQNASDDCGNGLGNGSEIISGPSVTDPPVDNDSVFRALAVDPADPNVIFFGTERNGILKSLDGGATWSRKRMGLKHARDFYPEVWDIAFDPNDSSIVFAAITDGAGLVTDAGDNAGVYKSTDGGETWFRTNCGLVNSKNAYIAFSPSDSNILLAAIQGERGTGTGDDQDTFFDGGIYRSTDGGQNWAMADMPEGSTKNRIWIIRARGDPATYYTFAFRFAIDEPVFPNIGFLQSTDEGASWTVFAHSLKDLSIVHFDVSADGQILYAVEQDSFEFHYSADGGTTWEVVTPSPPPQGPVAISPVDTLTVIYGYNDQLIRTTDGMSSVAVVATADDAFQWIEFAPSDPNVIYAGARGYLLYRSADGGATFAEMSNGRDHINSNP